MTKWSASSLSHTHVSHCKKKGEAQRPRELGPPVVSSSYLTTVPTTATSTPFLKILPNHFYFSYLQFLKSSVSSFIVHSCLITPNYFFPHLFQHLSVVLFEVIITRVFKCVSTWILNNILKIFCYIFISTQ